MSRYDFCERLVEKLCRIPARYRNDATLISDLDELFGGLDWDHWDRMLKAAIAHDTMIQNNAWVKTDEDRWLKHHLHPICRNGFSTSEQIDNVRFNNELEALIFKATYILGYDLCDEFFNVSSSTKNGDEVVFNAMQTYHADTIRLE